MPPAEVHAIDDQPLDAPVGQVDLKRFPRHASKVGTIKKGGKLRGACRPVLRYYCCSICSPFSDHAKGTFDAGWRTSSPARSSITCSASMLGQLPSWAARLMAFDRPVTLHASGAAASFSHAPVTFSTICS